RRAQLTVDALDELHPDLMLQLEEPEALVHEDLELGVGADALERRREAAELLAERDERLDVLRASQTRPEGRVETLRGDLGLRQIRVDVVLVDDALLGSDARLPRPEDEAEGARELGAQIAAEVEARRLRLHHDVDDGDLEAVVFREELLRLTSAV